MSVTELQIVKADGTLPWRVVRPDGRMVQRFETKRQARAWLAILGGDVSGAVDAYRDVVRGALRGKMGERAAWWYAVMWAQELGLGPNQVRADPDTGAPLDEK